MGFSSYYLALFDRFPPRLNDHVQRQIVSRLSFRALGYVVLTQFLHKRVRLFLAERLADLRRRRLPRQNESANGGRSSQMSMKRPSRDEGAGFVVVHLSQLSHPRTNIKSVLDILSNEAPRKDKV